ncbi:hypothetical protein J3459_007429 [Metarhizium acridum]|nr:hypothetical protein J3459_007429 [Metarhizium acridum]
MPHLTNTPQDSGGWSVGHRLDFLLSRAASDTLLALTANSRLPATLARCLCHIEAAILAIHSSNEAQSLQATNNLSEFRA